MSRIAVEALLIVALMVINGVFAMSEIAMVSARRARLQQRAEAGDAGARRALAVVEEPTRFLSTVQIGITLVGILAGAFGGATIAEQIAERLRDYPAFADYSEGIALAMVVLAITYLSLVVGELVPKRIGLNDPERIASLVARPMHLLSLAASPAVRVLGVSTELLLRLLRVRKSDEPAVTEGEITMLLEQGTQAGVFEEEEQDLVERVFWLADQRVAAVMTPRHRIVWLDLEDAAEENWERMVEHRFTRYLLCEGDLDTVLGMVDVKDLWAARLAGEEFVLPRYVRVPLYVPAGTRALDLLERFRETGVHLAVVFDEYGGVEGLVTLHDLLEAIAGDLGAAGGEPPAIVQREDGSLLVDASLSIEEFRAALGLEERRGDSRGNRTVGGLVFSALGHVPAPGEYFHAEGWRIEVVDMDGNRVDKVLASRARRSPRVPGASTNG
jgi:putative hemolysin